MNWGFNLQSMLALLAVGLAFGYSAWALLPAGPKRRLAQAMTRWRWLGQLPAVVRAGQAPAACGQGNCGGCDRPQPAQHQGVAASSVVAVIRVIRQRPAA